MAAGRLPMGADQRRVAPVPGYPERAVRRPVELPYNHDLMRVTADPDISLDTMSALVRTSLPTEFAKSSSSTPASSRPLHRAGCAGSGWPSSTATSTAGWGRWRCRSRSMRLDRVPAVMPRAQHGRYEEPEWYGAAFHDFASEGFLWLQHAMMPLDQDSPLRVSGRTVCHPATRPVSTTFLAAT